MNEIERQQVDLFFDGDLPSAEAEALLKRLEDDPEAVAYLAERSLLHNDLRRSIKRRKVQQWAMAAAVEESSASRGSRNAASGRPWAALVAASIGVALGIISTSLVWGTMSSTNSIEVRQLLNEGFEDASLALAARFPEISGVWNATQGQIVRSESAAEGQSVLRFGPAQDRRFSYINRIVDVTGLGHVQGNERIELRLRVCVRAAEGQASGHRYRLRLAAFAEDPSGVREQWFGGAGVSERALSFSSRASDVGKSGWVTLDATLPLPSDARNVVISVAAGAVDEALSAAVYEADNLTLELVKTRPGLPSSP